MKKINIIISYKNLKFNEIMMYYWFGISAFCMAITLYKMIFTENYWSALYNCCISLFDYYMARRCKERYDYIDRLFESFVFMIKDAPDIFKGDYILKDDINKYIAKNKKK